MNLEKKVLSSLDACYAIASTTFKDENYIIAASEERGGCFAYNLDTDVKTMVWSDEGGTMTIVPLKNDHEFEFLATRKFYPGFNASKTELVHAVIKEEGPVITKILDMPFLHRFEVFERKGTLHFIGSTLCQQKESIEDWSSPGQLITGIYDKEKQAINDLTVLKSDLYRNHGFSHDTRFSVKGFYATSDNGCYFVYLNESGFWSTELVMSQAISEVSTGVLSAGGKQTFTTIEPFHGDVLNVYQDNHLIYSWDEHFKFGHINLTTRINGKKRILAGCRQGDKSLFTLTQNQDGSFIRNVIDLGGGPANVVVIENGNAIVSTNGNDHEVVLYRFIEEETK